MEETTNYQQSVYYCILWCRGRHHIIDWMGVEEELR